MMYNCDRKIVIKTKKMADIPVKYFVSGRIIYFISGGEKRSLSFPDIIYTLHVIYDNISSA